MKVTVCVKRVPSTTARVKIASDGISIDPSGVEFVINPYDEYAVEEALKQVEAADGGEVTILSLGPESVTKDLRTCLAMGATRAVHIVHDTPFRDSFTVARVLAEQLKAMESDLILFGRQAVDNDNAQVGLMVATLLGMPAVADIVKLEISDGEAAVEREVEGGTHEVFRVPLPCVFTTQKGLNEPRYPNLKGIMAAKKKPIETIETSIPEMVQNIESLELPPERKGGRIVGEGVEAVPELLRLLRDEAGAL